MAWYYGTFSCGHEGRVNIVGPVKDRKWKAERQFEKLCEKCWEAKLIADREKANVEAARQAKEMNLPELIGTEKQVAWATTLRQKRIEEIQAEIDSDTNSDRKKSKCAKVLDYMLKNKNTAPWYIDNRNETALGIIECLAKEMPTEGELAEKALEQEVRAEATIFPRDATASGIVDIKIKADRVAAIYVKDENFREIVKDLGYRWQNGAWEKKISEITGTGIDRAAELGNKLLNAGFPICILDAEARQKAIDGTFEPEHTRWIHLITNGDYKGRLGIRWQGMDTRLYNVARRLPGSKYISPYVVVKIDFYKEIEEFAELYEFRFTAAAKKAIEQYKNAVENATVIEPVEVQDVEYKDGLEAILDSSREVIEDLLDT